MVGLQKNDQVRLSITSLTFDGLGVGKWEGVPIFVRDTAPGDEILCRIVKVQRRFCYGICMSLLKPSPDRAGTNCPVSGPCGGCCYHHVRYDAELNYKRQRVIDSYRLNYPGSVLVNPVIPSFPSEGYRHKVLCPFGPDGKTGFFARNSHRVIPWEDCRIQHPDFAPLRRCAEDFATRYGLEIYEESRGTGLLRYLYLRRSYLTGKIMVCAVVSDGDFPRKAWVKAFRAFPQVCSIFLNRNTGRGNGVLGHQFELLWGEPVLEDGMNGLHFSVSPGAFYQVNPSQAARIYADAKACGLRPEDTVLDLYCGTGTIGLTLAGEVKRVVGVEVIPSAVENARENARRNQIENASFFTADASDFLSLLREREIVPDAIVVDPPRKGLSAEAIQGLRTLAPRQILYISCDPATQARDAARLADLYTLGPIRPYDMFPRTAHVETVALMSRINE